MAAKQFFLPYAAATINAVAEPGAQLAFYTTGTTTKLPVYTTSALTTTQSNPVVANSAGRFPDIYLNDSLTYRLKILDRNGALLDDIDPFVPGNLLFDITANAVTPQLYGAVADGVTDDSAAFVAAIAALKAQALNTGGAGFYKGSAKLFIPAGHYYMGTTTIDVNHTLIIEGEGSGRFGPAAFGCARLRWAAGSNGIRIQHPGTSGNTTVDGAAHDGSGGVVLRGLCLQGGYVATEGDYHGLVCRGITTAEDLYIINWQGEGVKGWAGTVSAVNYGGNFSISCFKSVRCEGNRIGWDIRGSDTNVAMFINCEGYQNRQAGIVDENGSGPNVYIGIHCASNGDISGATPTKCTYSSKWYAAKWGGDFTVAPSGTTADTANWIYISAGSADATHPAHTATPSTFRAGGDFVTLSSAGVTFYSPYSEGNGFSQFNLTTLLINPAMTEAQYRGGRRLLPKSDGLGFQSYDDGVFNIDTAATGSYLFGRDLSGTARGYIAFINGASNRYNAVNAAGHDLLVGGVTVANISASGIGYPAGNGGTVTQATSRTTGVTLNKVCGSITLFSAAGTATWQTFTVTNSMVAATDSIRVVQKSGTDKNMIHVTAVAAGSFDITFATTGGTTTEQPVFNFAVLKAVAA